MLVYTPEVSVCLHELYQCLQELNCSGSMASSMTSSTEADLTQVIPLLVDGIAQEIGAERRDMRVTFVADHRQHDLSSWSQLKYQLMPETSFVWQRPNDLSHPRAYFEISVVQFQLGTHPTRMAPHGWIGSPVVLEAFLHLQVWHARYPKDSGSKCCLELNTFLA